MNIKVEIPLLVPVFENDSSSLITSSTESLTLRSDRADQIQIDITGCDRSVIVSTHELLGAASVFSKRL